MHSKSTNLNPLRTSSCSPSPSSIPNSRPKRARTPPSPPPPPLPKRRFHHRPTAEPSFKPVEELDLSRAMSIPMTQMDSIDWKKDISLVTHIPGGEGKGGVFICSIGRDANGMETKGRIPVIVVKGSGATIAGEIFASLLGERMRITCPKMTLVERHPKEPQRVRCDVISQAIIRTAERYDESGLRIVLAAQKQLNKAFFLLMEWMQNDCTLASLAEHTTDNSLHSSLFIRSLFHDDHDCSYWRDIGTMMILDIILNEFDRVPGFFENNGNADNILLQFSHRQCIAIDQSIHQIRADVHRGAWESYLSRVRLFVGEYQQAKEAIANGQSWTKTAPMIATSVRWIQSHLPSMCTLTALIPDMKHGNLESHIRYKIASGILEGISNGIEQVNTITMEELVHMKHHIRVMKTGPSCEGIFTRSLQDINVDAVYSVMQEIQKAISIAKEPASTILLTNTKREYIQQGQR